MITLLSYLRKPSTLREPTFYSNWWGGGGPLVHSKRCIRENSWFIALRLTTHSNVQNKTSRKQVTQRSGLSLVSLQRKSGKNKINGSIIEQKEDWFTPLKR